MYQWHVIKPLIGVHFCIKKITSDKIHMALISDSKQVTVSIIHGSFWGLKANTW